MRTEIKRLLFLFGTLLVCSSVFLLSSCESKKQPRRESQGAASQVSDTTAAPDRREEPLPVSPPAGESAQQLAEKPLNTPKGAVKVKFVLENKDNVDTVRVVVSGAEGASFTYSWTKNSEPAGEGDSISGFKRGDKIAVTITPFYGKVAGEPKTMSIEIKNSVPRIVESKQLGVDGKVMTYQVKAVDPDGDEVAYALADAPKDMTIDKSTGIITWHIGKDTSGKYPVKVKISDGHGGEVMYDLNVNISETKTPRKQS